MRLYSAVSRLGLILIVLNGFGLYSQTQAASTFENFIPHNHDVKRSRVSKREAVQIDRVLRALIHEIFVNGKAAQFLERHLITATQGEREFLDEVQDLFVREDAAERDPTTLSRWFAAAWEYEEFPFVLMVHTVPLQSRELCPKCCEKRDEASSLIDHERERILKKYGIRPDEFYAMLAEGDEGETDRATTEKTLTTLEKLNRDLFRFIISQTKSRTFAANLETMKRDRRINRLQLPNETVYEVVFRPVFRVVLTMRGRQPKIIALGDLYDPC